jgi:exodeoxyribonuclease VII large subunit
MQEVPVYSVTEISQSLKQTVEMAYGYVRVKGEISGLKRHSSGHIYFTLKDANAVLDAVSWQGVLKNTAIALLEDGLEIIATGQLTTYPGRSKYQITVKQVEASGQGALLNLLEERKSRLAAEGLFEGIRKKALPRYPQKIGIVTSPTGAVLQDILHRLEDRYPCHVLVWPVLVQGQGAADQIAAAIDGFNKLDNPPDLLIVARGGGSLEDLWAFNEEIVVRAAAASRIPLISAVGHETDTTLIDHASDLRAPTPTAAAEMAVPVLLDLWRFLADRQQRLTAIMAQDLSRRQAMLTAAIRGLPDLSRLIEDKIQRLDDWGERLPVVLLGYFQNQSHRLAHLAQGLRHPRDTLIQAEQRYGYEAQKFRHAVVHTFGEFRQGFDLLSSRLEQASYQKILERGFCWTTALDGSVITRAAQVKKGASLTLHYVDGAVSLTRLPPPPRPRGSDKNDERQGRLF